MSERNQLADNCLILGLAVPAFQVFKAHTYFPPEAAAPAPAAPAAPAAASPMAMQGMAMPGMPNMQQLGVANSCLLQNDCNIEL